MNLLQEIITYKQEFVNLRKSTKSLEKVRDEAQKFKKNHKFLAKIEERVLNNQATIIAEIKKASPSAGIIVENFDVAEIAASYKSANATCLSVLTDEKYFKGSDQYINIAKAAANLPILRKDFIIDEYQIYESAIIGADAILLILSCLTDDQAKSFEEIAISLGLDVLIETHNEEEIKRALKLKSKLIGINNRNLSSLKTSLDVTKNLYHLIPNDRIIISESGISSQDNIKELQELGINCFLIGESLLNRKLSL